MSSLASRGLRSFSLLVVITVGIAAGGCRRKHVSGTVAVDAVLDAWASKGFATEAVKSIEPDDWNAGACSRGLVAGLDALMCEYAADELLAMGEQKINADWEQAGVNTGVFVRNGRTVLAIADATKVDPNGRTIALLVDAFRSAH